MADNLTLTIDGQQVEIEPGATILEAAQTVGIEIPTICYHEATTSNALCRMCVVEVEGQRLLQPACIVKAANDMKVKTNSEKTGYQKRGRKVYGSPYGPLNASPRQAAVEIASRLVSHLALCADPLGA